MAGLLLVACVLRVHNAWVAPAFSGFDGPFHASYIGILHFEQRLPLPDEGWSTFHPPLYYAVCAIIWRLLPSSVDPHTALFAMRLVNVAAGLAIGLAVQRIARLLLPASPWTAVAAAAIALFLPMHVGPSSRIGNEMLAAMLSIWAVLLLLRCLREPDAIRRVLPLGCVLGLAALTKFSALVVLGVAALALAARGWRAHGARVAALRPSVVLGLVALLVSGAYFARNVYHYGTPIVIQVPIVAKFMERQGYGPPRSLGAYLSLRPDILLDPTDRAARTLDAVWPVTFATAWYDIHGATLDLHSVWGMRFARILFACGGAVSLFALLGLLAFAVGRVRFAVPLGGAVLVGLGLATLASYVGFTYRVATYSALKASYMSPALPAFAVFAALGMARVAAHGRAVAAVVGAFALLFVGSVTAIFWSGWLAPMVLNPAHFYVRAYADEPTWRVFEHFGLGQRPAAASAAADDAPPPPDVVLITLDTTRADHLGAYGYPKATTPAIDAFAAEAPRLRQCLVHLVVDVARPRVDVHRAAPDVPRGALRSRDGQGRPVACPRPSACATERADRAHACQLVARGGCDARGAPARRRLRDGGLRGRTLAGPRVRTPAGLRHSRRGGEGVARASRGRAHGSGHRLARDRRGRETVPPAGELLRSPRAVRRAR